MSVPLARGGGDAPDPSGPSGAPDPQRPRLGVTPVRRLVLLAAAAALVTWACVRALDTHSVDALSGQAFAVPVTLPIIIAVVAVGVFVSASNWRRRLAGDERVTPAHPLAGARALGLAKACSHTGALVAGIFGGYAAVLLERLESDLRRGRFIASAATVIAALVLVAAGLVLERSLRLPDDDETDAVSGR